MITYSGQVVSNAQDPKHIATFNEAQSLFLSCKWSKLGRHLDSGTFSPEDHPHLQSMWFASLYETYKNNRRLKFLTPAQRYRIRRGNPLPASLASTKFSANKFFDDEKRAVMDKYFNEKSKYVLPGDGKDLVVNTGLRLQQIKNYFKNKRSRTKDSSALDLAGLVIGCSVPEGAVDQDVNIEIDDDEPVSSFIKIEPMSFDY